MIELVTGSLFDSNCEVYVNPVNCVGVMGAGLALDFKHRYPAMMDSYKKLCDQKLLTVGRIAFWDNPSSNPKQICLFPTKHHWKDKSTIEGIENGLRAFIDAVDAQGITSVAFPKLGCGLGGLDFVHEIKPLMTQYLDSTHFSVEIYI